MTTAQLEKTIEASIYTHQSYDRPYGYWLRIPFASEWFDTPPTLARECFIGLVDGFVVIAIDRLIPNSSIKTTKIKLSDMSAKECSWLRTAHLKYNPENDDIRIYISSRFRTRETVPHHRTTLYQYKIDDTNTILLRLRMKL